MLRALETELEPLGFRLALSLKISVTLEHFAFLPWFLVPTPPNPATFPRLPRPGNAVVYTFYATETPGEQN